MMTLIRFFLLLCALCFPAAPVFAVEEPRTLPRKLIALYDSRYEYNLRGNAIHRLLEMPSNRLGYDVEYHDINHPLPMLDADVHGILVWFHHDPVPRVPDYIAWLEQALKSGKRLIVLENMGTGATDALDSASRDRLRFIESRLGYRTGDGWQTLTYNANIIARDPAMVDFERKISPPYPSYLKTHVTPQGKSYLRIANGENDPSPADLIVTGPQGGMAAAGYISHYQELRDRNVSQWYINPFLFLKTSLAPPVQPVPDVTTLVGRRIFYAHIDGDGWNNLSHIPDHREKLDSSADVIEQDILRAYSDFPFSVGIVAGDVTDECFGSEKSRATAKRIFALPNTEPTSHTYTHPLFWEFFEHYTPEREKPYRAAYPKKAGLFSQNLENLIQDRLRHKHPDAPDKTDVMRPLGGDGLPRPETPEEQMERILEIYETPRSYDCVPFDETREIETARDVIETLSPPDKKVKLVQWSGNTSPYERFLRKTREAGLLNINGGESRFDSEYPSYSTLYPLGIRIGQERQIYSTASNENTYTNLWTERFFGYRYLIETLKHTESPIRVTPFNIYFHAYSGERQASLQAIRDIMEQARKESLVPIHSSDYAALVGGFYTTRAEPLGENGWRIHNRGALQTLRFDHAEDKIVDEVASAGVLGQSHYQGSLYVFLNPAIDKPELILINAPSQKLRPPVLSLLDSRWNVLSAERLGKDAIRFSAQGFGRGEMRWAIPDELPQDSAYAVTLERKETAEITTREIQAENGVLTLDFGEATAVEPVGISLKPVRQTTSHDS